ncbi:MAG TPA: hypothetical protein VL049_13780 [Candidatus Dormibacteraeota bacterium]|nr:hypothetical protein [Candidatus Dormibacteraeota bacterium]
MLLVAGWHVTWPDLDRDFNHLHGWSNSQEALIARNLAEEWRLRPVFGAFTLKLFDAVDNYFFFLHYPPLHHATLALVFATTGAGHPHRTIRLVAMAEVLLFLLGLYGLAREIDPSGYTAAWALFLGAVNAEVIYFGAFTWGAFGFWSLVFTVSTWWGFLRWWRRPTRGAALAWVCALLGGLLASFFFYPATVPMAALLFLRPRRRGDRNLAILLLLAPVAAFAVIQGYYKYGLPLLVGHAIVGTGTTSTMAARTQFGLLGHWTFWRLFLEQCWWFLSPPLVLGAAGYYATSLRRRADPMCLFAVLTLVTGLPVIAFPGATLDHQATYLLLIPALALAAASFIARFRSFVIHVAAVLAAVGAAFWTTADFKAGNNTPPFEFKTGVALALFTPEDSFVRMHYPLNPLDECLMLLFYAHRTVLFDVPKPLRAVGVAPRFDLSFVQTSTPSVPQGALGVVIPNLNTDTGLHGILVDLAPRLRPAPPALAAPVAGPAVELTRGAITAAAGAMQVVELEWARSAGAQPPVRLDVGETDGGAFAAIASFPLGGAQVGATPDGRPLYRGAYLVETQRPDATLSLRLVDETTGEPFAGTPFRLERAVS